MKFIFEVEYIFFFVRNVCFFFFIDEVVGLKLRFLVMLFVLLIEDFCFFFVVGEIDFFVGILVGVWGEEVVVMEDFFNLLFLVGDCIFWFFIFKEM